jgi:hypothetical protein
MMSLNETIKQLEKAEKDSKKRGYKNDARNIAFKRHVLILLKQITKGKRKPSKYQTFIGKEMSNGASMEEAVELWKEKKKSKVPEREGSD